MPLLIVGYDVPFPWCYNHNVCRVRNDVILVISRMYYPAGQRSNGAVRFNGVLYHLDPRPDEDTGLATAMGVIRDQPLHCMN